jgi:hypothetical protein
MKPGNKTTDKKMAPIRYVRHDSALAGTYYVGNSLGQELTCLRSTVTPSLWEITFKGMSIITGSATYFMVTIMLDAYLLHICGHDQAKDDAIDAPPFSEGIAAFDVALQRAELAYESLKASDGPKAALFNWLLAENNAPIPPGSAH